MDKNKIEKYCGDCLQRDFCIKKKKELEKEDKESCNYKRTIWDELTEDYVK